MRAELKGVHSPDVDDLDHFVPTEPDRFSVLIQLMIGPKGEDGAESFDVEVCTARWLDELARECGLLLLRHYLLVERYDWRRIVGYIEGFINGIEADSWQEVATRLGRLGHWEFEDYRPWIDG